MTNADHKRIVGTVARLTLGAVLFLVVASYLAIPCMTGDASQFRSLGAANSCSEHHLFKPQADLSRLFDVAPAEAFRLPVAALLGFAVVAAVLFAPAADVRSRLRRRSRPSRLPFSTSDPPILPYFAAARDA